MRSFASKASTVSLPPPSLVITSGWSDELPGGAFTRRNTNTFRGAPMIERQMPAAQQASSLPRRACVPPPRRGGAHARRGNRRGRKGRIGAIRLWRPITAPPAQGRNGGGAKQPCCAMRGFASAQRGSATIATPTSAKRARRARRVFPATTRACLGRALIDRQRPATQQTFSPPASWGAPPTTRQPTEAKRAARGLRLWRPITAPPAQGRNGGGASRRCGGAGGSASTRFRDNTRRRAQTRRPGRAEARDDASLPRSGHD